MKVTNQAFKVFVQVTIGISRLKRKISKQITIQLVVGMLLLKNMHFKMLVGQTCALEIT